MAFSLPTGPLGSASALSWTLEGCHKVLGYIKKKEKPKAVITQAAIASKQKPNVNKPNLATGKGSWEDKTIPSRLDNNSNSNTTTTTTITTITFTIPNHHHHLH
ncbi:hypothetical protein PoB_003958600 [Plakobranchus ocellatus]|uniref:Uncharacterized protein n=1 Tax=Plakobranchus ocellatus TaxID=259542 RepID=A0AAV4B2L1_9GAST|nr:hypothetical protein PoB_003958600 [Plakobranchus ocellatus]